MVTRQALESIEGSEAELIKNMCTISHSRYEMCLQGIMVVVFIILDWIFVLMNTTAIIPCRNISQRELAIVHIFFVSSASLPSMLSKACLVTKA